MTDRNNEMQADIARKWFQQLQYELCDAVEAADGKSLFQHDSWQHDGGGGGLTRLIVDGALIEKGGVNYSNVLGDTLPDAATRSRPELVGRSFEAMGVSVVMHPHNPRCPTAHMNVRFFTTTNADQETVWWFGGGFDLTPYYPREEDVRHWHQVAQDLCQPFGIDRYAKLKARCDKYFYLPHRDETRGVGGLFFDDYNEDGFDRCLEFVQAVGNGFTKAYLPILQATRDMEYGEREREFQLYRRGRYVEFNLVFDRGTLFGLQSGGRTESILMSMPPMAKWLYDWKPDAGSEEAVLYERYLQPQDWLAESS